MALLVAGALLSHGGESKAAADARPNIVLILADDLGWSDIAAFGGEISTPNLTDLASAGRKMRNFYVSPACSPTRAMLLSGTDNHLAGLGAMAELPTTLQRGKPGYEGVLSPEIVTFPELLQQAGYRTVMAGKWHLGMTELQGPAARGFDRSLAMLHGGAAFFDQTANGPDASGKGTTQAKYREDGKLVELPKTPDLYVTDFLATKIIEYIAEGRRNAPAERQPFFAYAAFTAPHFPLQAPDSIVAKYAGVYERGYEAIRKQRVERLLALGLIDSSDQVAPMQRSWPSWKKLTPEQRRIEARKMAVYAAMVESVDRNVGRIVSYLKAVGEFENTLFVFLSDNGPEGNDVNDLVDTAWIRSNFDNSTENIGRRGSYTAYGPGWGQVSATPFKMFKGFTAEGGIRSPTIISFPRRRPARGVSSAVASVKDLAPTFLDVAGIRPGKVDAKGRAIQPFQGRSLWPYLLGQSQRIHHAGEPLAMELFGRTMLREGEWKLSWDNKPWGDGAWALYNLRLDPAEQHNVAKQQPQRTRVMLEKWKQWSRSNNVLFDEALSEKFEYTNTRNYYETLGK